MINFLKWFKGGKLPPKPYEPLPRYTVFFDDGYGDEYIEITHSQGMYGVVKSMKAYYPDCKIKFIDVELRWVK